MGTLTALLGKRLYLDANVFIYALNDFQAFQSFLRQLFDAGDSGDLSLVTSELTMAEVLIAPFRDANPEEEQKCRRMLTPDKGLALLPITVPILEKAARIRSATRVVRLPDAIHLATAIASGCDAVLTNDQHFKAARDIPVMMLSEMA